MKRVIVFVCGLVIACGCGSTERRTSTEVAALVDTYLARYFETFPSRATEAGRHDRDTELEDLGPDTRQAWIAFVQKTREELRDALSAERDSDARLDGEALSQHLAREAHEWAVLQKPERDPLFWTGIAANATVFLLARDEGPLAERVEHARARARLLPRLVSQATAALGHARPEQIAPELCRLATSQATSTATFYRTGFPSVLGSVDPGLESDGRVAADALDQLAAFLADLSTRASGFPRLGEAYGESFRLGTGLSVPPDEVRAGAERDLAEKLREAAAFGRTIWQATMAGAIVPADDAEVVRRLFARIGDDRDTDLGLYVQAWRDRTAELERFVRERRIMTLPDPLTLRIDVSPPYFLGASVGGVYPAGPFSPESLTLLYLPVPPASAGPEGEAAFFRDFNQHFNTMITPHELIPGHYTQLKYAARHPRKVRALFPDPLYVEGWGTFSERLMLDEGWGSPLDRMAHLKKQMENIARVIVDIRVHTRGMTREEVLRFVKDEALQDEQFAANMWTRAITTSPQITTYHLGYREVREVYEAWKAYEGDGFELQRFMDGMMRLGPVPVRHYLPPGR